MKNRTVWWSIGVLTDIGDKFDGNSCKFETEDNLSFSISLSSCSLTLQFSFPWLAKRLA